LIIIRKARVIPPAAPAVVGGGTVLFDNSGFSPALQSTSGAGGFSFTAGSGGNGSTNMVLAAAVMFVNGSGVAASPSLVWGATSLLQIGGSADISGGASGTVYLFGAVSVSPGTRTVTASWTGSNQVMVAIASFVAADQTGGSTTFRNVNPVTGSGTPNSVGITSAAGEKIFAGHVSLGNFSSGSGTDIGHLNTGNICSGAGNWDLNSGSPLTYAFTAGSTWASMGCSIKAA
jgi:hypothetical protein